MKKYNNFRLLSTTFMIAAMVALAPMPTLAAPPADGTTASHVQTSTPGVFARAKAWASNLFKQIPAKDNALKQRLLEEGQAHELENLGPAAPITPPRSASSSPASSASSSPSSDGVASEGSAEPSPPIGLNSVVVVETAADLESASTAGGATLHAEDARLLTPDELTEQEAQVYRHLSKTLFKEIPSRKITIIKLGTALVLGAFAAAGDGRIYQIDTVDFIADTLPTGSSAILNLSTNNQAFFAGGFLTNLLGNAATVKGSVDALGEAHRRYNDTDAKASVKLNRPVLQKMGIGAVAVAAVASAGRKLQLLYTSCGGEHLARAKIGLPIFSIAVVPIALIAAANTFKSTYGLLKSFATWRSQGATPDSVESRQILLGKTRLALRNLQQMKQAEFTVFLTKHPVIDKALESNGDILRASPETMKIFLAAIWDLAGTESFKEVPAPVGRRILGYSLAALIATTNVAVAWLIPQVALATVVGTTASYCLATAAAPVLLASHVSGAKKIGEAIYDEATNYDQLSQCYAKNADEAVNSPSCARLCGRGFVKACKTVGYGLVTLWQAIPAFGQSVSTINGGPDSLSHVGALAWSGGAAFGAGDAAASVTVFSDTIQQVKLTARQLRTQRRFLVRQKYESLQNRIHLLYEELRVLSDASLNSL